MSFHAITYIASPCTLHCIKIIIKTINEKFVTVCRQSFNFNLIYDTLLSIILFKNCTYNTIQLYKNISVLFKVFILINFQNFIVFTSFILVKVKN